MHQRPTPSLRRVLVLCAVWLLVAVAAAQAQTITVWILDYNDQVLNTLQNEWVPEFEALHPGVKVVFETQSWTTYNDKLLVAFAAGTAPDIVQGGAEYRGFFADAGIARPIDDYLAGWPEWQDFVPGAWETVVWEGRAYGVPALTSPRTIVYNKAVFDEVGLPHTPPADWEEFRTTALRTGKTDSEGNYLRVGIEARKFAAGLHFVLPFFLQNGVDMFTPDGRRAAFNTPAAAEALEYLADLSQNVSPIGRIGLLGTNETLNFIEGKSAMMYTGAGVFNTARQRNPAMVDDIGVAPPLTRKVQAGVTYTDWWAVTEASPHPEIAFEFIKFLSEPDRIRAYNEMLGTIPPRNAAITSDWIAANPDKALYAQLVLPHAKPYFSSPQAHQMNSIFGRVLPSVMDGLLSPVEALERAAAEYNALY